MRAKLLIAAGAVGLGIVGSVYVASLPSEPKAPTEKQSAFSVGAEPTLAAPPVRTANRAPITSIEDDRKVRDFQFRMDDAGLQAEGVEVKVDGEVIVTSQESGGTYRQLLQDVSIRKGDAQKSLARGPKQPPQIAHDADRSKLRFVEYFAGVDVEYTYDGKDVEEFFHLSESLLRELQANESSLWVKALLPGLSRENGTLLTGLHGTLLMPDAEPAKAPRAGNDALLSATGDVELNHQGHRFGLPSAVAFDAKGEKIALRRTFEFTSQGLEIGVELPATWISDASHPVVIDPSVIDSGRSLQAYTWQERNMVRDTFGRLHVAYMAVVNGRWHAMYTSGDGADWNPPTIISSHGAGENTHYTPNLVIDSKGTLHALWPDWGYGGSNLDERGPFPTWQHRLHIASCPNYCRLGQWSFDQRNGGKILTGGSGSHHAYHSLAIDRDDVLHIMFEEGSSTLNIDGVDVSYPYRTRYFQVANGVITEKTAPTHAYHSSLVYVGTDNQIYALNSDYYNSYLGRHFKWDRSAEQWSGRADFPRVVASGCTAYHQHHGALSVASDGVVHFTNQQYLCGTWMVVYGKYTPSSDSWSDVTSIHVPTPEYHEDVPSITVDEDKTVHLVYRKLDDLYDIMYARKANGASWDPLRRFARAVDSYGPPQIRARRPFPVDESRGAVNAVMPHQIDVISVEAGGTLVYLSTGAPLDAPEPRTPRHAAFVTGSSSCTPEFTWGRVAADVNNSVQYRLEVSSTPAFTPGSGINVAYDKGTASRHTLAAGLMTNGNVYYWRVQASNASGAGPYSKIYEVGCDTQPPSAFNLIAPASGSDPGTKTPTLQWQSSTD